MRSAVLAAQRLPHLVSKMGSESLRTAKASLLLNVSAMERPFRSLREVHGLPSKIKTALDLQAVAANHFQTALGRAPSKQEVRTALLEFIDGFAFAPLVSYGLLQCEGRQAVR